MSKTLFVLSKNTSGKPLVNIDEISRIRHFFHPALKRRFFLRNFLRFLVPCLIPILLLGSLSIFITYRYIGNELESNTEETLNQYSELMQVIISELDSLDLAFDQDPRTLSGLKSVLTETTYSYEDVVALSYLKNMLDVPANSKPYIHSIYVYYDNEFRRFLSSMGGISYLDYVSDRDWLALYRSQSEEARSRDMWTTRRISDVTGTDHTTSRVVSVYKSIAKGKGVIVLNVNPSYFEDSFTRLRELNDQSVYVTDRQGNLMMSSEGSLLPISISNGRTHLSERPSHSYSYTEYGHLISMKSIPRLDWALVTIVPQSSLYKPLRSLTQITIVLSASSILISAILAYWMTRKNFNQVYGILQTLNNADHPTPFAVKVTDLYGLIVQNLLDTFLQQKYLKVQLSERKYKEQILEFRALQSQINPHFLNNTLHSIYWKSFQLTRSQNDVSQMVGHLSDLLDYAVRTTDEFVSLEEELTYIRSYLKIQQARYPELIEMKWDLTEGLEACSVLKLSLQPIIENSIQYGLEAKDKLKLKVRARMADRLLRITILDNGPGISEARMLEIETILSSDKEQTDHVGLFNTFRRLGLKYDSASHLRIITRQGCGTAVTLLFPQPTKS